MKKIWKFTLTNIDTLLVIVMCVIAAVFGVFGADQSIIVAAIAAVLGVLAYGILRDRIARDNLLSKVNELNIGLHSINNQGNSADRLFATRTSETLFIEQAKEEIWLVQETGSKVIEESMKSLERLIVRGGKVKLIIASSDSEIIKLVAMRNRNLKADDILSRQNDALRKITSLRNATLGSTGSLEVRRLAYPLDITAVFSDPQTADPKHRITLVRMAGFRNFFDDKRDFTITQASDPNTFQYFLGQFQEMWQLAQEQKLS
jgi:hypothetical protein